MHRGGKESIIGFQLALDSPGRLIRTLLRQQCVVPEDDWAGTYGIATNGNGVDVGFVRTLPCQFGLLQLRQ